MQDRPPGRSDLRVSHIGLGTMTWGEQNDEAQAHEQLDAALAAGVNFVDTAEMYPVAPRAETYGRTEQIIGSWLARTARRHDRSEEHTSELQSLMRISYAVFCLKKKKPTSLTKVEAPSRIP